MTDFDTLEQKIRADAERKIAAGRGLADAQRRLLDARADFAKIDAENQKAVDAATKAAIAAGFTESVLNELGLGSKPHSAPRRRAAKRSRSTVTPAAAAAAAAAPTTASSATDVVADTN